MWQKPGGVRGGFVAVGRAFQSSLCQPVQICLFFPVKQVGDAGLFEKLRVDEEQGDVKLPPPLVHVAAESDAGAAAVAWASLCYRNAG